jgi:HTH-type transcriptional regulator/antitoxin HigA
MQNMTSSHSGEMVPVTHEYRLKIIRSDEDLEQAMDRMLVLMRLNPPLGSQESDEMDVLGLLIERYEDEHYPIDDADPIEVIKFMMDQQNLRKKDLIPYIGSASKVTEVLNGKRNLSLSMIRRLSEGFGIPAATLIQPMVKNRA